MKPGDPVIIYTDPLTRTNVEGIAIVIQKIVRAFPVERWVVRFIGDDPQHVIRTIRVDSNTQKIKELIKVKEHMDYKIEISEPRIIAQFTSRHDRDACLAYFEDDTLDDSIKFRAIDPLKPDNNEN